MPQKTWKFRGPPPWTSRCRHCFLGLAGNLVEIPRGFSGKFQNEKVTRKDTRKMDEKIHQKKSYETVFGKGISFQLFWIFGVRV